MPASLLTFRNSTNSYFHDILSSSNYFLCITHHLSYLGLYWVGSGRLELARRALVGVRMRNGRANFNACLHAIVVNFASGYKHPACTPLNIWECVSLF